MKKKHKLRLWQAFLASFLMISLVFLLILWLVLTVFLDDIYQAVKKYESVTILKDIREEIRENGDTDLLRFDERYDTRVFLIDSNGKIIAHSENASVGSVSAEWMQELLRRLYQDVKKSGKKQRVFMHEGDFKAFAEGADLYSILARENRERPDRIVDMDIVEIEGNSRLILLTTKLYPVRLTTMSIRWVLIFGSFAFFLFSLFSSIVLSRAIARPMENINRGAAQIASGDYTVDFPDSKFSEISELSQTLNYTSRELKVTEDLQHEIIANVSHDLRTPLTMIRGYAEVMQDLPGENSEENLQIIIDEADRLSDLINDILFVSRLESAEETPVMSVYSISRSISSILYRIRKLKHSEGFVFLFDESEKELFVSADAREMDRVLYNLIGNAMNYAGEDRTVAVQESEVRKDGRNYVRIEVTDHGGGIKEEDLPHIWDRYYRAESEKRDSQVGTGIGLTIARDILEMHHAAYGVATAPGKGSTFWFELPAADA